MPGCLFRGLEILHLELRGMENAFMTSMEMRAVLSKPVADEMGWAGILEVDGWDSTKLKSAVGKGSGTLKPNGKPDGAISFEFDGIKGFQAFESDDTGNKPKHTIRFTMRTSDKGAVLQLAKYWMANQKVVSHLAIKFQELLDEGKDETGQETKEPTASAGLEE